MAVITDLTYLQHAQINIISNPAFPFVLFSNPAIQYYVLNTINSVMVNFCDFLHMCLQFHVFSHSYMVFNCYYSYFTNYNLIFNLILINIITDLCCIHVYEILNRINILFVVCVCTIKWDFCTNILEWFLDFVLQIERAGN